MEILELKEKIHKKVETSEKSILETIYILLEDNATHSFELTNEEADEIDKDVADYLSGKTKGYTFEEVKLNARKGA